MESLAIKGSSPSFPSKCTLGLLKRGGPPHLPLVWQFMVLKLIGLNYLGLSANMCFFFFSISRQKNIIDG